MELELYRRKKRNGWNKTKQNKNHKRKQCEMEEEAWINIFKARKTCGVKDNNARLNGANWNRTGWAQNENEREKEKEKRASKTKTNIRMTFYIRSPIHEQYRNDNNLKYMAYGLKTTFQDIKNICALYRWKIDCLTVRQTHSHRAHTEFTQRLQLLRILKFKLPRNSFEWIVLNVPGHDVIRMHYSFHQVLNVLTSKMHEWMLKI